MSSGNFICGSSSIPGCHYATLLSKYTNRKDLEEEIAYGDVYLEDGMSIVEEIKEALPSISNHNDTTDLSSFASWIEDNNNNTISDARPASVLYSVHQLLWWSDKVALFI